MSCVLTLARIRVTGGLLVSLQLGVPVTRSSGLGGLKSSVYHLKFFLFSPPVFCEFEFVNV